MENAEEMKLPKQINIAGVTFKVFIADGDIFEDNPRVVGTIDHRHQIIIINGDCGEDYMGVTFWHEVLHAILSTLSFEGTKQMIGEDFIDPVSYYIHQVYKQLSNLDGEDEY